MDLATNLLMLVIMGIAGCIVGKIINFEINKLLKALSFLSVVLPLIVGMFISIVFPSESINMVNALVSFFIGSLPGIVIGDAAAVIVAAITGQR
ncbi:MAG: hypothetical protein ACREBU_04945 [Nitrososphaera sp.]